MKPKRITRFPGNHFANPCGRANPNLLTIRLGTRDHEVEGCLILVNQTTRPQIVRMAAVAEGVFSLALPGIGVGSGTMVLHLARPAAP